MFIRYLKELSLKKILKTTLKPVNESILTKSIEKIGILIDQSYFLEKENLINAIINKGIKRENITLLLYNDKLKNTENNPTASFSYKNMKWDGSFDNKEVEGFINTTFDMLISYYDLEKAPLLLVTHNSKALFKVGLSTIDKRLNHLIINTNAENFQVFVDELFKYLKILKKYK